jgi:predicted DNA-binding transcriptional regulator AlpA
VDHWKTAGVLQSSENSLYTHIRKLALAPPQKIKIGNPVGFQIIEIKMSQYFKNMKRSA